MVATRPYVFCTSNLLHMEYNFDVIGGCSRFIWTHFEVYIMMLPHAVQKLYAIYPRYQRGWIPPPSCFDCRIFIPPCGREANIPFFRGNVGLHSTCLQICVLKIGSDQNKLYYASTSGNIPRQWGYP